MSTVLKILLVGIGATIIMDIAAFLLHLIQIQSLDYRFLGRWIGHFFKGVYFHKNITQSDQVAYEAMVGWIAHYLIGITFSFLLYLCYGNTWFDHPTLLPALLIGLFTIIAPFFIMQPAFGFGIAASKLTSPNLIRLKSLFAHTVYGIGLYMAALVINRINTLFSSL